MWHPPETLSQKSLYTMKQDVTKMKVSFYLILKSTSPGRDFGAAETVGNQDSEQNVSGWHPVYPWETLS